MNVPRWVPDEHIGLAWLVMHRAMPSYDPGKGAAVETFLYRRIRGAIADEARTLRRRESCLGHLPGADLDMRPGPGHADTLELRDELDAALTMLRPKQKRLLWLRNGLELSAAEAGRLVGMKPGSVDAVTSRARKLARASC